ncbi:MAG: hypothetical protein IJ943_05475 [Akkermansia sp.]|jgi:hypothetical protein|nr:hypothetical protein [Akkermansia sp.]
MIAFKNNRPLLQNGYCVFSDYDLAWLVNVLQEAAESAGTTLPFKEEIAAGVLQYLENNCPLHAVPLDYLFDRMRSLLNHIGLPLIATHLRKQTPPIDIELDTLAEEAPLPLFFYTELRRRMDNLRDKGLTNYHFSGMARCSFALGDRRRACPTQRRALAELNAYLLQTQA